MVVICHQIVTDEEGALREDRVAWEAEPYVPDSTLANRLLIQIWIVKTTIEEIHWLSKEEFDECVQDHRSGEHNNQIKGLVS